MSPRPCFTPSTQDFYIFAIIMVGTHSKTTLRIDPTFLPLLTETPFIFALFAYVARQLSTSASHTGGWTRNARRAPGSCSLDPTRARPKAPPSLISLSPFLRCWRSSVAAS
jgi:hypothetical protein